MTDPLHGTAEDVRFDHVASADLARACRNAATSIEDQAGSRASWVQHGLVDFAGYYSQVFSENGHIQAADAGGLVIALRNVATAAEYLAGSATKEQERRETARAWKHRRDNRNALDHIHDFFMGEEDPPFGPPDPPEPQYPPIPAVAPRTAPTSGSSSSGTSSARPGHLRTFADNSEGANDSLSSYTTSLRTALDAFTSGCGWGTLSAEGVLTAFGSYLTANGNDVTWARTVAAAFEEAGDGSIVTLSNASITAALQAIRQRSDAVRIHLSMSPPGEVERGVLDGRLHAGAVPLITPLSGLAYLPLDQVRRHLEEGRLVRVLGKFTPDLPGYHLYYPHRRHASSAFTLLVETLRFRA